MVQRLCITVSDKTYRDYIQTFKGNKSNFIEDNFLTGIESDIIEVSKFQVTILQLKKKNRELEEELLKLKQKLKKESEENKNLDKDEDLSRKKAFLKGIKNAGII